MLRVFAASALLLLALCHSPSGPSDGILRVESVPPELRLINEGGAPVYSISVEIPEQLANGFHEFGVVPLNPRSSMGQPVMISKAATLTPSINGTFHVRQTCHLAPCRHPRGWLRPFLHGRLSPFGTRVTARLMGASLPLAYSARRWR